MSCRNVKNVACSDRFLVRGYLGVAIFSQFKDNELLDFANSQSEVDSGGLILPLMVGRSQSCAQDFTLYPESLSQLSELDKKECNWSILCVYIYIHTYRPWGLATV